MPISRNTRLAADRFAVAVSMTIDELGITRYRLAKIMGVRVTTAEYWCSRGLTSSSRYFIPLCEELGLDPSSFGFSAKKQSRLDGNRDGSKHR